MMATKNKIIGIITEEDVTECRRHLIFELMCVIDNTDKEEEKELLLAMNKCIISRFEKLLSRLEMIR